MSWFAELAGKAESLLNNLDEQTGAALRNHHVAKKKIDKNEISTSLQSNLNWGPKRRLPSRNIKKPITVPENKSSTCRKLSPLPSQQSHLQAKDNSDTKTVRSRKSSPKKPSSQYTLNNSPKTLVGDAKENEITDCFGLKQRRNSLPADLELMNDNDNWLYKLQNVDIENTMLRNELNVMNREVAELLDKLHHTEDGNDVDCEELAKTKANLESSDQFKQIIILEKENVASQMELLKQKIQEHISNEVQSHRDQNNRLQEEINVLRSRNKDLEEKCKEYYDKSSERDSAQIKLENDLRHAQSTIVDLQNELEKSRAECVRLEKDWESYKLRVKNMLHSKDSEIRSLQEGREYTEEMQDLMAQIENLKEERDELSETTATVRRECEEMRVRLQRLEANNISTERVVTALRDALLEERTARNRAEGQWVAATKELRNLQMETGQTIASLQTALRDKDDELNNLRDFSSTLRTTDTSALNVADYDVMQDTIENDKIQHLTETLVQRQSKIDKLLADNNILKIQLEKLEVCLHLWVLTVLFTSTPENFITRPSKS